MLNSLERSSAHPHVLCMDYIEGAHLPEWLETNPDQNSRDFYAQQMFDFQLKCLLVDRQIHADPNFGNFFIMNDGRIGLIDFGCVRKIEPEFAMYMPEILRAYIDEDWQRAWDTYAILGMVEKNSHYPDEIKNLGEWISRPYRYTAFDFRENSHYMDETQVQFDALNEFKSMHPNYVFFTRWHMGLYRMAILLDATMNMTGLVKR